MSVREKTVSKKTKILFFAETVTLAHLARPAVLAQAITGGFDTYLAASTAYDSLFSFENIHRVNLHSISSNEFLSRLARGKPVYTKAEINEYVENDLKIIEDIKPALVVGDFRVSLYISCKLAKVPYVTITNAYWSPHAKPNFVVPELPFVKLLGTKVGQFIFDMARPLAFKLHANAFNQVCRKYNVTPPGNDIRHVYTVSDLTLFSDIYELYEATSTLKKEQFIGPVLWNSDVPVPPWWHEIPSDKPKVYVTMGSSGDPAALPLLISTLKSLDCTPIISGDKKNLKDLAGDHLFIADFIPGDKAAEIADLVICNGGSPATQQALFAGKPVIGIPRNLDQYSNMRVIEKSGAGRICRGDDLHENRLKNVLREVMVGRECEEGVQKIAKIMKGYDCANLFLKQINSLVA